MDERVGLKGFADHFPSSIEWRDAKASRHGAMLIVQPDLFLMERAV